MQPIPWLGWKVAYLFWECETSSEQLPSLDKVIRLDFIPAIPGYAGGDIERVFLALPAKMGALGLQNVASDAELFYLWSRSVTRALVDHLLRRNERPMTEVVEVQRNAFKAIQRSNARRLAMDEFSLLTKKQLLPRMKRAAIAAEDKGSSSWLTALTLEDFGFLLLKGKCQHDLHLWYGWTLPRLPSLCVCGDSFGIDYDLSCSHGGFLGIRRTSWETFSENSSTKLAPTYVLSLFSSRSMVSSFASQPTLQGWTSRLEDFGVQTDMNAHIMRSSILRPCTLILPPHPGTTLPSACAGQMSWVWRYRSCSKCGQRNLYASDVLCHRRCWSCGNHIPQAAGWQIVREEEQQLLSDSA